MDAAPKPPAERVPPTVGESAVTRRNPVKTRRAVPPGCSHSTARAFRDSSAGISFQHAIRARNQIINGRSEEDRDCILQRAGDWLLPDIERGINQHRATG